jgi:hypothetical protein
MARRIRSYRGTPAEHRTAARGELRLFSGNATGLRKALERGNCRSALTYMLNVQGAYSRYLAQRGWAVKRAQGAMTPYRTLRRLEYAFARKCVRL